MKIKELLKIGTQKLKDKNIEDANLKAKILLKVYLNTSKEYLIIHEDDNMDFKIEEKFLKGVDRLLQDEPIQYIINNQEFMGLNFYVDKNVLIPQPDTEILVEEVISIVNSVDKHFKILDLCTGSGAIGVSLAKYLKNVEIYASDISKEALRIARNNAKSNNVDIKFMESNLFEQIDMNIKFDIIVSNPPYIETDIINTLSEEVKKEPILALDGGKDGRDFYRKIAKESKEYLNEKGVLALEIGYNQKETVKEILENEGYKNIYSKKDLSSNDRIVVCESGL